MSANHFTRKAGSGDMDMHTYAPFRQQLNVPFGTHKLQDFIYCLPLKFGIAFDASARFRSFNWLKLPMHEDMTASRIPSEMARASSS